LSETLAKTVEHRSSSHAIVESGVDDNIAVAATLFLC
jgi:hypothetical protein